MHVNQGFSMRHKKNEAHQTDALESQAGYMTPRYRSGQRSAQAMLEAGRALLAHVNYEGLSVSDLCKEAGLTTGAFYRRFESKDAFFLALQRLALDDADRAREETAAAFDDAMPLAEASHLAVEAMREWNLRHRGVLRASMQRRDHTTGGWEPFREVARVYVEAMSVKLARTAELRGLGDAAVPRLVVAFQIVLGTMINSALNDPGPLKLDDPAMTEALAKVLELYAQG
jgi:AcrR family transcriptional regulator